MTKTKKVIAIAASITAGVVLVGAIVFIVLINVVPHGDSDRDARDAVMIAERDFGCDKVLWVGDLKGSVWAAENVREKISKKYGSKYYYYVIGEKNGEEIYIAVPSHNLEKPVAVAWPFDFTFREMVAKLNENGAGYEAGVTADEYYDKSADMIELDGYKINDIYEQEEIAWWNRMDVDLRLKLTVREEYLTTYYYLTQESGELCVYKDEYGR